MSGRSQFHEQWVALEFPEQPVHRGRGETGIVLVQHVVVGRVAASQIRGLATREHTLWLQRGTDPQLYTVCTPLGVVLGENLDAAELGLLFPEFEGFERLGETDLVKG